MLSKQDEGKKGEDLAVEYLKKKGFKVIDRNFRIRGGEIDIIALDPSTSFGDAHGKGTKQGTLVFVEVKTRSTSEFGSPLEAITPWKIKNLVKTAQFYKLQHRGLPDAMRIDAVSVKIDYNNNITEIELVKNIT